MSEFMVRPHTQDPSVFDQVVRMNEYRLPPKFGPEDLIVDLGAHVGSFLQAVAERGCRRIVCVEPMPESFMVLKKNADGWQEHGVASMLIEAAVWADDKGGRMRAGMSWQTANPAVSNDNNGFMMDTITIDRINRDDSSMPVLAKQPVLQLFRVIQFVLSEPTHRLEEFRRELEKPYDSQRDYHSIYLAR